LLIVVLAISLFIYIFATNDSSEISSENTIHVKNETELKNAINNTPNNKAITIALDNDIALITYER